MLNVQIILQIARQATKAGDLQRALNILSGTRGVEVISNKKKVLLSAARARLLNFLEDYRCASLDSKELMLLAPTDYRGYNHAAIAANGCYRSGEAMMYLHTGLEKAVQPAALIVRLKILLEQQDYKDFVDELINCDNKLGLEAMANKADDEFCHVYKALMNNSDEAFAVFRAVAFLVKGQAQKAREIVSTAVLDSPDRPCLIAAREFLVNPDERVAEALRDVHFEADGFPDFSDDDNSEDDESDSDFEGYHGDLLHARIMRL